MSTIIKEHIQQMSDEELDAMVKGEYMRKLLRYKKIDETFKKKNIWHDIRGI